MSLIQKEMQPMEKKSQPPQKTGSLQSGKTKQLIFYICVVAYPLLQFLVFYVYVNINSLILAFKRYDYTAGDYVWLGFDNFELFFHEITAPGSILNSAVLHSLIMYLASLLVGITLALFFSFYIYKQMLCGGFFRVIIFLPSILSSMVLAILFKYFADQALPALLERMFGLEIPGLFSDTKTLFPTVVFYTVWIGFGVQMLMYTGVMSRLPESMVEYAKLDGIKPMREFFSLTLPLIYPTITTFIVAGVAGFFIEQANAYNFYGPEAPNSIKTIGYYLFVQVVGPSASLSDYPFAAAAAVVFTLVAAPVTLFARWILGKFDPTVEY